ncbi:unnamed protein product [Effrenium voratum]|nr:unnamed protein product [Effrenium voratum]
MPTGDVVTEDTPAWTPTKQKLMELTKDELMALVPENVDVKAKTTKGDICEFILSNWSFVINEAKACGGKGGGEEGDKDRGRDDGKEQKGRDNDFDDIPFPSQPDDGDLVICVQRTFRDILFRNFTLNKDDSVATLKGLLYGAWSVPTRHQRLVFNNNDLSDTMSLNESGIEDGSVVYLFIRGVGGGFAGGIPVQKEWLNKDVAMVELKRKQTKTYTSDEKLNIPSDALPSKFVEFLDEQKSKSDELVLMKTRLGNSFIRTILKQMSNENLHTMTQIFTTNRQRGEKNLTNEEKVVKAMTIINPQMESINKCQEVNDIINYHTANL